MLAPSRAVSRAARVREEPPALADPAWESLGRELPSTSASSMNTTAGARALAAAKMPCMGMLLRHRSPSQQQIFPVGQIRSMQPCNEAPVPEPADLFSSMLSYMSASRYAAPDGGYLSYSHHAHLHAHDKSPVCPQTTLRPTAYLDAGFTLSIVLGHNVRPLYQQQLGSSVSSYGHRQLRLACARWPPEQHPSRGPQPKPCKHARILHSPAAPQPAPLLPICPCQLQGRHDCHRTTFICKQAVRPHCVPESPCPNMALTCAHAGLLNLEREVHGVAQLGNNIRQATQTAQALTGLQGPSPCLCSPPCCLWPSIRGPTVQRFLRSLRCTLCNRHLQAVRVDIAGQAP